MTKSFLGGLKAVSWDFSPGNQCKINRDAYFSLTELSIDNLRNSTKPGNSLRPTKIIKLETMVSIC